MLVFKDLYLFSLCSAVVCKAEFAKSGAKLIIIFVIRKCARVFFAFFSSSYFSMKSVSYAIFSQKLHFLLAKNLHIQKKCIIFAANLKVTCSGSKPVCTRIPEIGSSEPNRREGVRRNALRVVRPRCPPHRGQIAQHRTARPLRSRSRMATTTVP